ncbi:MAG TPA: 2-C-methyl-D-erythritol 2,4-cyclodiphosphate synthase [Acidimicrobiales bacterium]|nr:2-C-methyl-D-erythritol 2,4-cyclodiphosphate synthase [Acidimicrobiales bacterium]
MNEHRIGLGVDLHRFATDASSPDNGPLTLGGVIFPGELALIGHSDADAVAHAIGDAILGAAGLGDLGTHFPDTDPRWRGANSLDLLGRCVVLVAENGWALVNADCTIITEEPKIAPMRDKMIERLSNAAGGPVHVKATRPEGLGTLGRVEGVACLAVVLLGR